VCKKSTDTNSNRRNKYLVDIIREVEQTQNYWIFHSIPKPLAATFEETDTSATRPTEQAQPRSNPQETRRRDLSQHA
jgi:hypothetical protein